MITLSVKADVAALRRTLVDDFMRRQLPFATGRALTQVARKAQAAERAEMRRSLDRPNAFTLRGVAVKSATKEDQAAVVYILPLQARFLAPSILGGKQLLGQNTRAVLAPKNVRLDAYGNLPKGLLASLRARPDIFIGPVTFADGKTVSGVWQLPPGERVKRSGRGITGGRRKGWKLLIRFADPAPIKPRYRFGQATLAVARAEFPAELRRQLALAMRTAR